MTKYFKGGACASVLALSMAATPFAAAKDATLKIGGRVMIDYTLADIGGTDINATEARRVRLNASGKYGDNIKYKVELNKASGDAINVCLLYTSPSPRGATLSRMPSSA